MGKPILCLDFDGVISTYESGWKGINVIPDPPVEGAFTFIRKAMPVFDVQIYSSRSKETSGISAMKDWFEEHGFEEYRDLVFPEKKPAALVTIDDRALTFTGKWPSIKELLGFRPWNKRKSKGKIIALVGLQASGKSTWAKEQVEQFPKEYKRVNKDELREMIDIGNYSQAREKDICHIRDQIITYYVNKGYTVIIDDTNFNPLHWKRFQELSNELGCMLEEKFFWVSIEEAIQRNDTREKRIPAVAIRSTYSRYLGGVDEGNPPSTYHS